MYPKVVEWGAGGGMGEGIVAAGGSQGIKSEAARLMAAVVKNGKSKEVRHHLRKQFIDFFMK